MKPEPSEAQSAGHWGAFEEDLKGFSCGTRAWLKTYWVADEPWDSRWTESYSDVVQSSKCRELICGMFVDTKKRILWQKSLSSSGIQHRLQLQIVQISIIYGPHHQASPPLLQNANAHPSSRPKPWTKKFFSPKVSKYCDFITSPENFSKESWQKKEMWNPETLNKDFVLQQSVIQLIVRTWPFFLASGSAIPASC